MALSRDRLRELPSVDEVLRAKEMAQLFDHFPRWAVTEAIREEIDVRRQEILDDEADNGPDTPTVEALEERLIRRLRPAIRSVINATGVVVHTNLGRSPLAEAAVERLTDVARGYSNLEYDLVSGRRGSRHGHLRRIASELCGAEDAVITNNNAAAVLLTVSALAAGREVVVSRGELVEIGGGFRIPDVIVQGGARLREVGTTNRTRVADYAEAIGPDTAALLKVHRSNFDVVGFTEDAELEELAELAHQTGLPLIDDLGSGAMTECYGPGLTGEPVVHHSLEAGSDVVCFSGDKLLGGPQAGLILGRADLVTTIRSHPLMRAVRPCKLTLSALEATLELWRDGRAREIPIARMLAQPPDEAKGRAQRFARRLRRASPRWNTTIRPVEGRAGGGSMPLRSAPGWAVALRHDGASSAALEKALRAGDPPVICRILDGRVLLDLRTVPVVSEKVLSRRLAETDKALTAAEGDE